MITSRDSMLLLLSNGLIWCIVGWASCKTTPERGLASRCLRRENKKMIFPVKICRKMESDCIGHTIFYTHTRYTNSSFSCIFSPKKPFPYSYVGRVVVPPPLVLFCFCRTLTLQDTTLIHLKEEGAWKAHVLSVWMKDHKTEFIQQSQFHHIKRFDSPSSVLHPSPRKK